MQNVSRTIFTMAIVFATGFHGLAGAQDLEERKRLIAEIERVTEDPQARKDAIEAGRERTLLCSKCHGKTGNRVEPGVPNLAGQNPAYLLEQIEKFADGRRDNFVMRSLARSFSFEDKRNLAIYFSSMAVDPPEADPALAAKGEKIFQTVCQRCHGEDGRGEKGYARLAGQQIDYVMKTLKRFRTNALKQNKYPEDIKRHSVRMEQVTQNLSDEEIEALANYIALLK